MLRFNDKGIEKTIEENLSMIRAVMDRKTFSPAEQCVKLDELSSLLGIAAETRTVAFHLCAHNERLAIDEKKLKGQSINKEVIRYTAYENMLYEYANTIHDDMIKSINALQTLISFSKKEGY
jgi:hypothetical protein